MERVMSVEDKIRRAEEIYYRRREKEMPVRESVKNVPKRKKSNKLLKKMIKQIICCLLIYGIFYLLVNSNYIFSEDLNNKIKEVLEQDINITQIYSSISTKINELLNNLQQNNKQEEITNQENVQSQEEQQNQQNVNNQEEQQTQTNVQTQEEISTEADVSENEENIGGAEEILTNQEQNVELSQMEQDANYVKSTVSFIKPVDGTISSKYGLRNPTTSTVPKNHTGTDIAAEKGTKIVSATDGIVILASSKGDYGNHLKIQINDVIVVYAHCNKLYVEEGSTITQGQEIAEVGATGNTTGPHLHFEIRYQDRYVDPEMVMEL